MRIEVQEPFASLLKTRCKELHQKESKFVERALVDALCADPAELARPWSSDREDVLRGRQDLANGKVAEWSKIRKHFAREKS